MRNESLNPTLEALHEHFVKDNRRQLMEFQDLGDRQRRFKDRKGIVSYARAIEQMATPRGLHDGPEAEFFREAARARGESLDPHRIVLPITCLKRDLTVTQATGGGYLVGVELGEAQHILRPWSVVIDAGVDVQEQLTGNVTIPKTVSGATIFWQGTETTQATPTTPVLSQASMTPHVAIAVIQASRNFMLQANPERWLRRELARAAGVAVDTAVLVGTGSNGQPLGILNTPGISTEAGASLAWDSVLTMKKNAAVIDVPDAATTFVSNPTTRALLEGRDTSTNGTNGFIWQNDRIANCPAYATTLMPAGTMVSGPLSGVTVGLWGDLRIELNPFDTTLFRTGGIQIRVLVAVDVAITVPVNAFTLASSIT